MLNSEIKQLSLTRLKPSSNSLMGLSVYVTYDSRHERGVKFETWATDEKAFHWLCRTGIFLIGVLQIREIGYWLQTKYKIYRKIRMYNSVVETDGCICTIYWFLIQNHLFRSSIFQRNTRIEISYWWIHGIPPEESLRKHSVNLVLKSYIRITLAAKSKLKACCTWNSILRTNFSTRVIQKGIFNSRLGRLKDLTSR